MKYLALGDSYTIGEGLPFEQNFPSQLCQQLKQLHHKSCTLHQLIATTGWTTDELMHAIYNAKPSFDYDLVSLLIGVNNQYRGRSIEEYAYQFYSLLCQAILFAKGQAKHVVVLSIPDWGLTPFNVEKDKTQVSIEIDAYNSVKKQICDSLQVSYIDITNSTREHATDPNYLASDLLHYSVKEYAIWAQKITDLISLNGYG
ncbi:MAG: GDSL-type esterase/lipase family protein [Chitinophagaceae bacterium]